MHEHDEVPAVMLTGWTLPEGWTVRAWTEPDDSISDPRDEGDVYNTDMDEVDYDRPAHAFCRHCDEWITTLDETTAQALGPAESGDEPQAGDWASIQSGITCPEAHDHEPAEPLAVRMWHADRWRFVGVLVEVLDADGREWGRADLWGLESGTFPSRIDPVTGTVTTTEVNPLTDEYPLTELVPEALEEAQKALSATQGQQIEHVCLGTSGNDDSISRITTYRNPDGSILLTINAQTALTFDTAQTLRDAGLAFVRLADGYLAENEGQRIEHTSQDQR
jgi:hypothetical protein